MGRGLRLWCGGSVLPNPGCLHQTFGIYSYFPSPDKLRMAAIIGPLREKKCKVLFFGGGGVWRNLGSGNEAFTLTTKFKGPPEKCRDQDKSHVMKYF